MPEGAIHEVYRAVDPRYWTPCPPSVRAGGRIGFSARGIAFAIIGGFLLVAAVHARSDEARGLGGALATLAQQPFGPWLLGIVASGLVVYGAFMVVQARYGRLVVR